jgi:formylglycine-generating enzyme required for sulfatase activity
MVVVPAGKFTMGSPYQQEWMPEGLLHEVTIENAFAVGKYVVTFVEWDICVAAGACPRVCDRIVYSGGAAQYVARSLSPHRMMSGASAAR